MKTPTLLLLLLATAAANATHAHAVVRLGAPTFSGTGCAAPGDRVAVELSADGDELQVAFPDSFAAANSAGSPRHTRVACNGVLPLTVPEGFAVGVSRDELRGAVNLPERGADADAHYAQVGSEIFFAAQRRGPSTKQRFASPGSSHFSMAPGATTWSACGGAATLRVHTALVAHGAGSSVRLDGRVLRVALRYKRCEGDVDAD